MHIDVGRIPPSAEAIACGCCFNITRPMPLLFVVDGDDRRIQRAAVRESGWHHKHLEFRLVERWIDSIDACLWN